MPGAGACRTAVAELLVIGRSARALAASARRAGLYCDVMDEYLDDDTRTLARHAWRIEGGINRTVLAPLLAAWRRQAGSDAIILPVSGFESAPDLLDWLQGHAPVAGNTGRVVRRLKDPALFFALLDRLGIPHPPTSLLPLESSGDWLCKPAGGEGGIGIRPWSPGEPLPAGGYLQRRIDGRSRSVVFLADGRRARPVGCNECRSAGEISGDRHDFRFAEAIAADPGPDFGRRIQAMLDRLVAATGLRGLCGMDLIERDGEIHVLEINPRPPASFELHEQDASLVAAHLAACQGRLAGLPAPATAAVPAGKRIVYAPVAVRIPERIDWPPWTADRPPGGSRVEPGAPFCTILARAESPEACRRQLQDRWSYLINYINNNLELSDYKIPDKRKEMTA